MMYIFIFIVTILIILYYINVESNVILEYRIKQDLKFCLKCFPSPLCMYVLFFNCYISCRLHRPF